MTSSDLPAKSPSPLSSIGKEKPAMAHPQVVSFTLRAPTGWMWTAMAFVYLLTMLASGNMMLMFAGLMTKPTPGFKDTLVQGYDALWLWVAGVVAATCVLVRAPHWKPEAMSVLEWFQATPWIATLSFTAVLVAVAVGVWHLTWALPARKANQAQ